MTASYDELAQHIDEIRRLYEVERMSTRAIALLFNTSKTQITRFFHKHEIPIRNFYEARYGMSRKDRVPTKEQLEQHLADGLVYASIGEIYNCDPSAVGYWIKRYGIDWHGDAWTQHKQRNGFVEPTMQELYMLYCIDHLSVTEIARKYKVTHHVICNRLRQYGIKVRPAGWAGKQFGCFDGHLVRSVYEQRVDNWLHNNCIAHEYEPDLPFNAHFHADFLARNIYIEIWGVNHPVYNRRKNYKLEQYALHNLPLIQITESDFDTRSKGRWSRKLARAFFGK